MNELEFLRDLRVELLDVAERSNDPGGRRPIRTHPRRPRSQGRLVAAVGVLSCAAVVGAVFVTTTTGASTPQSKLLAKIVASVQPSGISSATIGSPPRGFEGGSSSWLTISIRPGDQAANLSDEWKAALVAGTFRDLSKRRGLPSVAGFTTGQGAGRVGAPDHPSITAKPTKQSVMAAVERVGLSPASVRLLHPGEGTAVIVTATTTDAARFLSEHPSPAISIFGDINKYAGTFLEIDDQHGVAYITTYAGAAGQGAEWTRASLRRACGITALPLGLC